MSNKRLVEILTDSRMMKSHKTMAIFFDPTQRMKLYIYMYVLKTKECVILMSIQNSFMEEYDL